MKPRLHKITMRILSALRKAFFENLSLKLIAAFITLTLFILVAGESLQISKRVKIEYLTSDNMMIVNDVPFEFEMIFLQSGFKGSFRWALPSAFKSQTTGTRSGNFSFKSYAFDPVSSVRKGFG